MSFCDFGDMPKISYSQQFKEKIRSVDVDNSQQ